MINGIANEECLVEGTPQMVKATAKYLMFQSKRCTWERPFPCPCISFFSHPLCWSLWLCLVHCSPSSDYGTVMGMDANRINVNLGFFEGEGGRVVITLIIIQSS